MARTLSRQKMWAASQSPLPCADAETKTGQDLGGGGNDNMVNCLSFPHFLPGFIQTEASAWHLITFDKFVLDLVTHGFTVLFSSSGPSRVGC